MTGQQMSLTEPVSGMVLPGSSVLRRLQPSQRPTGAYEERCANFMSEPLWPPNSSSRATFPNNLGGSSYHSVA